MLKCDRSSFIHGYKADTIYRPFVQLSLHRIPWSFSLTFTLSPEILTRLRFSSYSWSSSFSPTSCLTFRTLLAYAHIQGLRWPSYLELGQLGLPTTIASVPQFMKHMRNTVKCSIHRVALSSLNPFSGTFVRISPVEVSIAHPEALQQIYGHNTGTTKSDMYDAFTQFGGIPSVFAARDRVEHARKRKIMSHSMSLKSVSEFEPIIHTYQRILIQKWDRICEAGAKGSGGVEGSCVWQAENGRAWFDCMRCKVSFFLGTINS